MRFTSIIHCGTSHNIQSDFSGPHAREDFEKRCENMGATWGHLIAEKTGKIVMTYQEEEATAAPPADEASLAKERLPAGSTEVMASALIADLATLVGERGDQVVLYAIRDEGAFNIDRPRFDTDGEDGCFLI